MKNNNEFGTVCISSSVLGNPLAKKTLSNSELVFMMTVLSKYLCGVDNTLRVGGRHNGRAINVALLSKFEGIPYSTVGNTLSSLKKKNVIALSHTDEETGYYVAGEGANKKSNVLFMNPYIMTKSPFLNEAIYLFTGSIWEELYNKNCK